MKKPIFCILLLVLVNLCISDLMAQDKTISGKVLDEKNLPVIGATVSANNTQLGTTTDINGFFRIKVPEKTTELIFSCLGMEKLSVNVEGKTTVNVTMLEKVNDLDEVIVVGYGEMRKSDLTGAVSSVKTANMEAQSMTSIDQGLQGRIAGVQINQSDASPGGGLNFVIRGSNSLIGGTEPLYVIDGFPLEGGNSEIQAPTGNGNPPQNLLNFLNPKDIESIEILKDASSTAIYGTRGANGVVLITTKKGAAQKVKFSVSNFTEMANTLRKPDPLNAYEFTWFANMRYIVQNVFYGSKSYEQAITEMPYRGAWSSDGSYSSPTPEDYLNGNVLGTDWFDVVSRTAVSNKTLISAQGGNESFRYYFSGGYDKVAGIVTGSDFERYSFNNNLNIKLNNKFTLTNSLKLSYAGGNRAQSGLLNGENRGVLMSAYMRSPLGLIGQTLYDEEFGIIVNSDDPYIQATRFKEENYTFSLIENIGLRYQILRNLSLQVNGGLNYSLSIKDMYYPKSTQRGYTQGGGMAFFGLNQRANILNEYLLNYNKVFSKKHRITAIGGYSMQWFNMRGFNAKVSGFINDILENYNFSAASMYYKPSSLRQAAQSASFISRINYNYDDRYLLTGSFRVDGNSRFGRNNKWGYFPSVGVAWRVDREKFFNFEAISNLKLRGSFGVTGNAGLAMYQSLPLINFNNVVFGDNQYVGYEHANIPNDDLKWEKTHQYNAGLDFGVFRNRVLLTVDFYQKNTYDLLQNLGLSPSTGYSNRVVNLGSLQNQGIEIEIKTVPIQKKNLYWDIAANWFTNTTKMLDLQGMDAYRVNIINGFSPFIVEPGKELGLIYGYRVSNIIKNQDDVANAAKDNPNKGIGNFDYVKDENGNMLEMVIGNTNPDFNFGFSSNFRYKNLTLNANFTGSIGNDIINVQRNVYLNRTQTHRIALNSFWIPEIRNSLGEVVIPDNGKEGLCIAAPPSLAHDISKLIDHYIEDGSYFKMNNLSVTYKWKPKNNKLLEEINPSLSVSNVFCITNYSGVNPETSLYGQNPLTKGVAYYEYPMTRSFSFGLSITIK